MCWVSFFIQFYRWWWLIGILTNTGSYLWWVSKCLGRGNRTSWQRRGLGSEWQQCWEVGTIFEWTILCFKKWFFYGCIPCFKGSHILWNWLSKGKFFCSLVCWLLTTLKSNGNCLVHLALPFLLFFQGK